MQNKNKAFTLPELVVAVFISVIILGGVFYFIGEVIIGIGKSSNQANFLKDMYTFTSIFDLTDVSIVDDASSWYDVLLAESKSGIGTKSLIWVVDFETKRLISESDSAVYRESYLAYRILSDTEFTQLNQGTLDVFSLDFRNEMIFKYILLKEFQAVPYNSDSVIDLSLLTIPVFENLKRWLLWSELPQEDLIDYTIAF